MSVLRSFRFAFPFILSVIGHFILVLVLVYYSQEKPLSDKPLGKIYEIQIVQSLSKSLPSTLVQKSKRQQSTQKAAKVLRQRPSARPPSAVSLKQLAPKMKFQPGKKLGSLPIQKNRWGATHDQVDQSWGASGGDLKRLAEFNLYDQFREKVEEHLDYPPLLARAQIQGKVKVRLGLDPMGECHWPSYQPHSGIQALQIYVKKVLEKVCQIDFTAYLGPRKGLWTNLDLMFDFQIADPVVLPKGQKILGNTIYFARFNRESIKNYLEVGPVRVYPLYLMLDMGEVAESLERWMAGEEKIKWPAQSGK